MFELVPSKYMRTILEKEGFEFTDFQKAVLIWNAPGRSWEEKLETLQELMEQTEDAALRRQIEERLRYEEEAFRRFTDNSEGRYVYVAMTYYEISKESFGFFAKYEMAREYVLKNIREDEELFWEDYSIEKQVIVRDRSDLTIKNRGRWNKYMFPEMAEEEEKEVYEGWRTSAVQFDKEGRIRFFNTGEMSREEELVVDKFNPRRFEAPFIKIPFAAWMGALVRNLNNPKGDYTDYGILMCDTKRWGNYLHDIEKRQFYVDFSDVQVTVYFLTRQGVWAHERINPLYLEIGERPPLCGGDERQRAYVRAMDAFGDYWYYRSRGTRTKEAVADLEKTAIRTAAAYRDACLEHDAQEGKCMAGRVEEARKLEDIMDGLHI